MKTWKDISQIELPALMVDLPRDARGYPIPWSVAIGVDGKPDFRVIDTVKLGNALTYGICAICGTPLGEHKAFVGGPKSMKSHGFLDPAMHPDCARYALKVCPFLAAPKFGYSRIVKPPKGMTMKTSAIMSTDRPERFGLGIASNYFTTQKGSDTIIVAGPWAELEWWSKGEMIGSGLDSIDGPVTHTIIKMQLSLATNAGSRQVLVYNEDRSIMYQSEADQDTIDVMQGQDKKFFHARLIEGALNIDDEAEFQSW